MNTDAKFFLCGRNQTPCKRPLILYLLGRVAFSQIVVEGDVLYQDPSGICSSYFTFLAASLFSSSFCFSCLMLLFSLCIACLCSDVLLSA